ncbi:hypothetical protein [Amycolatopsis echigonensis]|uniref:Uncharacterized protein n=1 Tax=Amycolatopsis echigonensis TaxID=2576905 RepID=A0A2N3WN04_9PSEU|nr:MULTISPECIES: hypothetical protein [Amycolatopsis]MBB2506105.1 hypothetical protein [Amycolatopsis echigonensis]PKV95244.1 hypothetical protein ATK30_6154 [Amycolatopsis niigatensis]
MESLPGVWSRAVHPYGLLCGFLMSVSAYPMRHWDAPVPMIDVVLFVPYYIGQDSWLHDVVVSRQQ